MKKSTYYNTEEIFNKFAERFEAIYILDLEKNVATKIKSSQDLKSLHNPDELEFNWDEIIKEFIEKLINTDYKNVMTRFYDRENLKTMFSSATESKECIHQLFSGKWNKVICQPLEFRKGITKKVLVSIIDFTYSKNQTTKIIDSAQISLNKYYHLFIDVADDIYGEIIKFNYLTGTASSFSIINDRIIEVPSQSWDTLYKQLFTSIHPEDKEIVIESSSIDKLTKAKYGDKLTYTYRSNRENPYEYRWYSTTIKITSDSGDATAFTQDITNSIQERKFLLDKSEHDSLTDLYNRNKLQQLIENDYKNLKSCGVLFFDVNNLKPINDQFGHEAGDKLLQTVAASIQSISSRNIHAFRYGGDEFLVIAPNIDKEQLDVLISLWKLRLEGLCTDSEFPCSAAVGSAWADSDIDIKQLINHADKQMYEQKKIMKSL